MKKQSYAYLSYLLLIILVGCGAYCKGTKCRIPNNHHPDSSQRNTIQGEFLSESEIKLILNKWNIQKLNPNLYRFFTDPHFLYNVYNHYDLGIEDDFAVLWLSPDKNGKDRAFLFDLNQKYGREIDELRKRLNDVTIFSLNSTTRLANNNIAGMLDSSKNEGQKMSLLRNVFYYCIMK